jgi:methylmalonyl-CoA/ethylmalonyl-CoA epimerase
MKKQIREMTLACSTLLVILVTISPQAAEQEKRIGFEISLHHVGISVPDAEKSAAWYHRMLGFEVVARMDQSAGMSVVHIKRGNCYIELFQVEGARPLPDYRRDPSADLRVHGIAHFAFQVSDVVAAAKELQAKGAEIALGPVDAPGVAFAFIRDNSGNCFELIQYKKQ